MTTHSPIAPNLDPTRRTQSGRYGWVAFARTVVMMRNTFHATAGLVALFVYAVVADGEPPEQD